MLQRIRLLARAVFRQRRFETEMDAEVRHHMAAYAADLVRQGMHSGEAQRRARLEFGSVESMREEVRAAVGARWFDELVQNGRYSVRQLVRSPSFTAAVVLSLALGIGANTAIFSLMDAVLFRTVPVARPERLFFLAHGSGDDITTASNYPLLERYRSANLFDDVMAYSRTVFTVTMPEGLERVNGQHASGNYHKLLGVSFALGRGFAGEPDRPDGRPPIAVISHDYWTRRFGGDSGVVGRPLSIRGRSVTIVGVTAPEFQGLVSGLRIDITLPLSLRALDNPGFLTDRDSWISLQQVARLRDGMTEPDALRHVDQVFRRYWAESRPGQERAGALRPAAGGSNGLRDRYGRPLQLLLGMVAIVLLIASANVANLGIARGAARSRELAVRLSLGANRSRIVRQMLTESAILSVAGGALGLIVAAGTTRLIVGAFRVGQAPPTIDASMTGRVLLFTLLVIIATSFIVGLTPALKATRLDVTPELISGLASARVTARLGVGRWLVVGQLALSMIVVSSAALLARTLYHLRSSDAGFAHARIVLFDVDAAAGGMSDTMQRAFYRSLDERLRTLPGVAAVAQTGRSPIDGSMNTRPLEIPGVPRGKSGVSANVVSPEYFGVFGIRILRGRSLSETDRAGAQPVAVVDDRFARSFLGGADPIGRLVLLGADKEPYTVVGTVGSSRQESLREDSPVTIYTAVAQPAPGEGEMGRRTIAVQLGPGVREAALLAALPREVGALSRNVVVSYVRTMDQQLDAALLRERLLAGLSVGYGALALLLSLVGLYGVTAYGVLRRSRDIGIRMALGATRSRVLAAMLREALGTSLAGVAVGLVGAIAATKLIAAFLYGVEPRDPVTVGAVAVVLIVTAILAALGPARTAASIDPARMLKSE